MSESNESCSKCAEPIAKHRPTPGCPYQGWTNYETWAVKLWLDNDEGSYRYCQEMAQEAYDETAEGTSAYACMTGTEIFTREERARYKLAEQLKEQHEEGASELLDAGQDSASVFSDLLNAALFEVNWNEVAESLLEDVDRTKTIRAALFARGFKDADAEDEEAANV